MIISSFRTRLRGLPNPRALLIGLAARTVVVLLDETARLEGYINVLIRTLELHRGVANFVLELGTCVHQHQIACSTHLLHERPTASA